MQFSPFSRYLIPLRSKYPPQHPVLKHPQLSKISKPQNISLLILFPTSSWHSDIN
jgi:hypothetical protein